MALDREPHSPQRSDSSEVTIGFHKNEPLVTVFEDAALYGDLLYRDPHANFSVETLNSDDPVAGFAELVGRDLDDDAKSDSARFAHFATALSWLPDEDGEVTEEPSAYESDTASSSQSTNALVGAETHGLSSKQIVKVLEQEFGELADDGEEEALISEADVAFFQDVTILARTPSRPPLLEIEGFPLGRHPHHNSPYCLPCLFALNPTRPRHSRAGDQSRPCHHPFQGSTPFTEDMASAHQRHAHCISLQS